MASGTFCVWPSVDGFMPVVTTKRSGDCYGAHRFTTPLLTPVGSLAQAGNAEEGDHRSTLTQSGCDAALMLADDEHSTIWSGRGWQRHLTINGPAFRFQQDQRHRLGR